MNLLQQQPKKQNTAVFAPTNGQRLPVAMEKLQAIVSERQRTAARITEYESSLALRNAELDAARKQPETDRAALRELRDEIQHLEDVLTGLRSNLNESSDCLIAATAQARDAFNAFASEIVETATAKFEGVLHGVILEEMREFYATCAAVGVQIFGYRDLTIPDPRGGFRSFGIVETALVNSTPIAHVPRLKSADDQAAIDQMNATLLSLQVVERQTKAISDARSQAAAAEFRRQRAS